MSREEEVRLLREIFKELKSIRAILEKDHPRNWETSIKEHMSDKLD